MDNDEYAEYTHKAAETDAEKKKRLKKLRRAIYGVGTAGAAVGVGYGLITETEALLWLGLFGSITGLAFYNTDPDEV